MGESGESEAPLRAGKSHISAQYFLSLTHHQQYEEQLRECKTIF
jgi:hypothetical protein